MAKKIIWSRLAEQELREILEYWVFHNNSTSYSLKLDRKINEAIELLSLHPFIGRKTDFENARVIIVDSYLVFYEVSDQLIIVISIWDGRQNPKKLKTRME